MLYQFNAVGIKNYKVIKIKIKFMKKIVSLGAVFGSMPILALAYSNTTIGDIVATVGGLVSYIIPVLITIAVAYFIWGIVQYSFTSDEEAKKKAKNVIIQGLIGLFVIVAFWGIIAIVQRTFGVDSEPVSPIVPCTPIMQDGELYYNC